MGVSVFGLGYLTTLVVASAISVYGFGFIEAMWGRGGSFQVLVLVSLVAAFVATMSFGITAALIRRFGSRTRSGVIGCIAAAGTIAAAYLISTRFGLGLATALGLVSLISALAAAANPKVAV